MAQPVVSASTILKDAQNYKADPSQMRPQIPEKKAKESKSQGAEHRSETATLILAAKELKGGEITPKDQKEAEKKAEEIVSQGKKLGKLELEEKLKALVLQAGAGKLTRKSVIKRGKRAKIRASQLILATKTVTT